MRKNTVAIGLAVSLLVGAFFLTACTSQDGGNYDDDGVTITHVHLHNHNHVVHNHVVIRNKVVRGRTR